MKVFKFGGASVNSAERIQNVGQIMNNWAGEKIVVIVSAMGKTTNAPLSIFHKNFRKIKNIKKNNLKYNQRN